jgi:hypothetical protein
LVQQVAAAHRWIPEVLAGSESYHHLKRPPKTIVPERRARPSDWRPVGGPAPSQRFEAYEMLGRSITTPPLTVLHSNECVSSAPKPFWASTNPLTEYPPPLCDVTEMSWKWAVAGAFNSSLTAEMHDDRAVEVALFEVAAKEISMMSEATTPIHPRASPATAMPLPPSSRLLLVVCRQNG